MRHPPSDDVLAEPMRRVEQQIWRAKRQLRRRVNNASTPLRVWNRPEGLTGIKGQVLVVSGQHIRAQEIVNAAQGQGFDADVAADVLEAFSLLKIAKYDLVIMALRSRGRGWRLVEEIRRNHVGVRFIPVVNNAQEGRDMMRRGAYSFLLPDYTADQVTTCIQSGLHLQHRVCRRLQQGEACDRSCVSNFMRTGELDDIIAPAPQEPVSPREGQPTHANTHFYQYVEE